MFDAALHPGKIGKLALPNRIIMGSMHLGVEGAADGQRLAAFYAERARGGAALIVTGGAAVSRVGAGGRSYGLVNEEMHAAAFARTAAAVHDAGGKIALQLFHAGRYAFESAFGLEPLAPSAVPGKFSPNAPRAMSEDDILETIRDFARAARRAVELGYDAVEIMGSEGYLLNQFLSPVTNRRDDAWGGDAARRMHFPLEVVRAIRGAVGNDYPIVFRMSGADLVEGSSTEDETIAFARALATGADAINVGIGWHESSTPTVQGIVPPGAWIPYAAAIKKEVGTLPVIASNRVNTVALADKILAAGAVDFISMARPFLADAAIVEKSASGRSRFVNICIACNQACIDRSLVDEEVSCMVNPHAMRESETAAMRACDRTQRFAVVGGGPAGLEAARVLASLGHGVTLFDADEELGGQFKLARRIPGKSDFNGTIHYFTAELRRLGVTLELGRTIDESDLPLLSSFDAVIVASGVIPRPIEIPGADLPHVIDYTTFLRANRQTRGPLAIIGAGGIGVDTARLACEEPERYGRITLLRRGKRIGDRIGRTTRWVVLQELREHDVRMLTGVTYQRILQDGVEIIDAHGQRSLIPAATVVIAAGQLSNNSVATFLQRHGIVHHLIGGARLATELDAVRAFREGMMAAYELGAGASIVARAG